MAAILARTYPDVFAAVAVHSGLAHGAAHDVRSAFEAMSRGAGDGGAAQREQPVPSLVIHGSADRTVAPVNGEQVLRQAMAGGFDPARPTSSTRHAPAGAHAFTESRWLDARGELVHEALTVEGLAHAWSGGAPGASYSDPRGPDATAAIWRFFDRVTRARLRASG